MKKIVIKSVICFVLNLLIFQSVFPQTGSSKRNYLSLSFGNSNYHSKDLMQSPLISRGNNLNISLLYAHNGAKGHNTAEVYFARGDMKTDVSHFTAIGIRAYLSYGYLQRLTTLKLKNAHIPFFIGGLLKSFANVTGHEEWNSVSWLIVHSLNINVGTEYAINPRHVLLWQFHFPLLSYVIRPPYAGFDEETADNVVKPLKFVTRNGTLATISGYFMLGNTIAYRYRWSRKFDFVAEYRFEYHRYAEPRSIKFFTNDLSVGFLFKF